MPLLNSSGSKPRTIGAQPTPERDQQPMDGQSSEAIRRPLRKKQTNDIYRKVLNVYAESEDES